MSHWKLPALAALACAAVPAAAAEQNADLAALDAQLPGELINDPSSLDWASYGAGLKREGVEAEVAGGAAIRFSVGAKSAHPYEIAASFPLTAAVAKGEQVTVGFWARTISADTPDGKGVVTVRVQQNASPYDGFADRTVAVGPDWSWYEASGVATVKLGKGAGQVVLQLGGAKQLVEIGQAIVVKGAPRIVGETAAPAAGKAAAVEVPDLLKDAGRLINDPADRRWGYNGPDGGMAPRDDKTIWLGKATRFTTRAVGANRWDVGTAIPIGEALKAGEKLLVAIAARTESAATDDGKALVGIRIQTNAPPYDGFGDAAFKVGPSWQLIRVPLTVAQDMAADQATVALQFAGAVQAVDIGPVYLFKVE
ncbi:hypothetical protein [Sphingopyxis indica]|uniref:Carbohydrate binding domain-containing protein n=2 Tax=Sphingopyxis indica TaxID=436663 RepID=A0A239J8J6_9SPHN|nr:hypothetical protein [Sphingopyxis indica]SNT02187.1 hypothetical protein SAMN06295955_109133 [Sphingopyxis indica]